MSELVRVERSAEGVASVVLNRPDRRNALTGPLVDELGDALEAINADDDFGVIVISGAGGAFCSGLDLKEFSLDPAPGWVSAFGGKWQRVHRAIFDSDRIVVGALERAAVNGGAALALACDFLVAGESAFLQVGEIQQGMAAPMNMAWLRLRHSESVAARVALLGDRISGPELQRLGLAHVSVPDSEVQTATHQLASTLAAHDPMGARRIKRALRSTSFDGSAEEWFAKVIAADPVGGRQPKPVAARDN